MLPVVNCAGIRAAAPATSKSPLLSGSTADSPALLARSMRSKRYSPWYAAAPPTDPAPASSSRPWASICVTWNSPSRAPPPSVTAHHAPSHGWPKAAAAASHAPPPPAAVQAVTAPPPRTGSGVTGPIWSWPLASLPPSISSRP